MVRFLLFLISHLRGKRAGFVHAKTLSLLSIITIPALLILMNPFWPSVIFMSRKMPGKHRNKHINGMTTLWMALYRNPFY